MPNGATVKSSKKNNNYIRGRAFEYKCKKILESEGYLVFRSAGSKGVADLVCVKLGEALLVQCKTSLTRKKFKSHISKAERDTFLHIASLHNISAIIMTPTERIQVFTKNV